MEDPNKMREVIMRAKKGVEKKKKETAPAQQQAGQEEGKLVWDGNEVTESDYMRQLKETFPDQHKKKIDKGKLN